MRIHIQITDDKGHHYAGIAELDKVSLSNKENKPPSKKQRSRDRVLRSLNFDLNPRAFMKKYGQNLSRGEEKFTLLIARLVSGKVGAEISHDLIKSTWSRMTKIMGCKYNRAYSTRAKDEGWVDSPKRGIYKLEPIWKSALATD